MAEENTKAASGKIKEEEVKKVALTFDDGPNPDHTETLLEGLKERNVKATFFLLGAECEKYPLNEILNSTSMLNLVFLSS